MIRNFTAEEMYSYPGFQEMIDEYAELAIKQMPKPLYKKEDYQRMEDAGVLTGWGAIQDGRVVGFASCIHSVIPHYGVGVVIVESLFVGKEARRRSFGIQLLNVCEWHAKSLQARAVFVSCPAGSAFRKLLKRRNYSFETETYVKVLQ